MVKLTKSSDLTLMHFCMSLDDPAEIRQYLAAYLGSKPEVSQFASEFIKRKHEAKGGARPQSSFAAAVAAADDKKVGSKGRKKK